MATRLVRCLSLGAICALAVCTAPGRVVGEEGVQGAPHHGVAAHAAPAGRPEVVDEKIHGADRPLEAATQEIDAVLLIDASGSMLRTDPQRLRDEGANLFVQFLQPRDRVALLAFKDQVTPLLPLTEISPALQVDIQKVVKGITNDGAYTDLRAAVNAAEELLIREGRPKARRVIVLLSDGKMDPRVSPDVSTPEAATKELLEVVLPRLRAQGVETFTLAFSDEADRQLLQTIAEETNGLTWYTPTADTIHESFSNLFLAVKKPQVLGLSKRGFMVDGQVEEATFYINREADEPLKLQTPSGMVLGPDSSAEGLRWFHGQRFDVITIRSPEVGSWQVLGIAKEGFATVLTNVKLVASWPSSLFEGETELLRARFFESEKAVVLPEMTAHMQFGFQITPTDKVSEPVLRQTMVDDGTQGDKKAKDNIFSRAITLAEPGEYRLEIVGRTPTFERRQQIPFRVKPRLVALEVVSEASGEEAEGHSGDHESAAEPEDESVREEAPAGGTTRRAFVVSLSQEARSKVARLKKWDVELAAVNAEGRTFLLTLHKMGEEGGRFTAPATILPHDGHFTLRATLYGVEGGARKNLGESRKVSFTHSSGDHAVVVVEKVETPAVVKKPEEQQHVEVEKTPSSWPYHLLVLLLNGATAGAVYTLNKRGQSQKLAVPELTIPADVSQGLQLLEAKHAETEVRMDQLEALSARAASMPENRGQATPVQESPAAAPEAPAAETSADSAEEMAPEEEDQPEEQLEEEEE